MINETKDRHKEYQSRSKNRPTQLPVLKSHNIGKHKGSHQENAINNSITRHQKLKSIDNKKRAELMMSKRLKIPSLEYVDNLNDRRLSIANRNKGLKNVRLEPIK